MLEDEELLELDEDELLLELEEELLEELLALEDEELDVLPSSPAQANSAAAEASTPASFIARIISDNDCIVCINGTLGLICYRKSLSATHVRGAMRFLLKPCTASYIGTKPQSVKLFIVSSVRSRRDYTFHLF